MTHFGVDYNLCEGWKELKLSAPPLWELHRQAFLRNPPGQDRYFHFKELCRFWFPSMSWNPWAEMFIKSLCANEFQVTRGDTETRFIAWTGCASAGKTYAAGWFAVVWWLLKPNDSAVVLTSTTKDAMSMRIWPVITSMFSQLVNPYTREHEEFGNLVNSAHRWQFVKGDDKHSILCQALDKGDIRKAVENIKGQHTERRMIIIDESNTTSEAILAAIPNARKGCKQFVVLAIGNAFSKMDFHGRFCAPKGGWSKIDASFEKWPTTGIKEHQIDPGWAVHADGEKSPNVIAKKTIYPYLYSYEDHLHALELKGSNEIAYWQYDRGFWASDDLKKTVMTESLLDKYDAFGTFLFLGPVKMISSADTSFSTGGDDPIQVFFKFGMLESGVKGIQLVERVKLKLLEKSKDPVEYQLADQMQKNCTERGVEPDCFGLDATAIGQGVASIMQKQWSASIHLIYFNMEASELRASAEDPRPSNEVYFNRRTELWWSAREALTGGVFKGMYLDAAIQFCGQEYEMKGRKYFVKPKEETKKRIGRSPDDADAIVIGIDVARQHGLVGGALPGRREDSESLLDFAREQHQQFNDDNMYANSTEEEVEA